MNFCATSRNDRGRWKAMLALSVGKAGRDDRRPRGRHRLHAGTVVVDHVDDLRQRRRRRQGAAESAACTAARRADSRRRWRKATTHSQPDAARRPRAEPRRGRCALRGASMPAIVRVMVIRLARPDPRVGKQQPGQLFLNLGASARRSASPWRRDRSSRAADNTAPTPRARLVVLGLFQSHHAPANQQQRQHVSHVLLVGWLPSFSAIRASRRWAPSAVSCASRSGMRDFHQPSTPRAALARPRPSSRAARPRPLRPSASSRTSRPAAARAPWRRNAACSVGLRSRSSAVKCVKRNKGTGVRRPQASELGCSNAALVR